MTPQVFFAALIGYTWILTMFVDRDAIDPTSTVWYLATVAPATLFIVLGIPSLIRVRYEKSALALLILMAVTVCFSLARADAATVVTIVSLCAMLISIQHTGVTVEHRLVNTLFVVTIMCGGLLHALGQGQYGLLPGQSVRDDVLWRVSMFPYNVTPSWLFALVVLTVNYFRKGPGRLPFMLAALYFIVMSAARTGYMIVALAALFLACTRVIDFRPRLFYKLFIPGIVVVFVVALNAESVLALLAGIDNPLLNSLVFKSAEGVGSAEQAGASFVRAMIWASHGQLFAENPWLGAGTFNIFDVAPVLETFNSKGTESFITGLFARIGILALLFVTFMYMNILKAIRARDKRAYCMNILFAITSLAYGSYIVPYDFIFLLVFGAMNGIPPARAKLPAGAMPATA
jgi:O-antigen ligase